MWMVASVIVESPLCQHVTIHQLPCSAIMPGVLLQAKRHRDVDAGSNEVLCAMMYFARTPLAQQMRRYCHVVVCGMLSTAVTTNMVWHTLDLIKSSRLIG
jgi:hypothetical protein